MECDFTKRSICGWNKADGQDIMQWSRIVRQLNGMCHKNGLQYATSEAFEERKPPYDAEYCKVG